MITRLGSRVVSYASLFSVLLLAACGGDDGGEEGGGTQLSPPESSAPQTTAPPSEPSGALDPALAANLPPGVSEEVVAEGERLYQGNGLCFTCHGAQGAGSALAPALNDGEWLWVPGEGEEKLSQIEGTIRNGIPVPKEFPAPMLPMGGAQLNDEQVHALASYVYALSQ